MTPSDELRALLQRYARAADERDVEALETVFHPDAEISGARGTQGRDEWLETMRAPRAFPTSMHLLGEPLISWPAAPGSPDDGPTGGPDPGPDRAVPDRATLDTYAVVYQLGEDPAGGADLTLGIRYRDEVVVHGGRWVIRRRSATTVWMR